MRQTHFCVPVRQETRRIACEYIHEYTKVLYIIHLVIADIVLNILTILCVILAMEKPMSRTELIIK